ncbi:TetR/AcrR family transcriptional regulator [Actinomadura madurae]|uniref:TetR/AcrR family transcriptional regulator n=1 Tax=Actinomadura madurae TaxID=1993 RepID=UPI00202758B5|nr:TetR/AcrR family transcriptional regulator [Actinomadura madurae]URM95556.1 TetR/AcrR family transcriptional regulator [Actinomadura madurae]
MSVTATLSVPAPSCWAALDEFSAKGYAGARVGDIAKRAGLNKQLITYYFGGKEGLYRAVEEQWLADEAELVPPEGSLDEPS